MAIPERQQINLTYHELKARVRDRLAGLTAGGPVVDPRIEYPYEWLVEEYGRGTPYYRSLFTRVLEDLLEEVLTGRSEWDPVAEKGLFALVQRCGHDLVPEIELWVDTLHPRDERDRDRLALLLKTLLALDHLETVGFWLDQYAKLGSEYGAVIFAALTRHGLEPAVRHLPNLCRDDAVQGRIEALLPVLCDELGRERVYAALETLPEPLGSELLEAVDADGAAAEAAPARRRAPSPERRSLEGALYAEEEPELVGAGV